MRTGVVLFLCTALLIIAGCAEVQRPTTEKFHMQQQLQSALHWQSIAKENSMRLNTYLNEHEFIEKDGSSPDIYVSDADRSPFGQAMRGYLLTELMSINPKLQISNNPDSPFVVSWNTQLVNRNPSRMKPFLGIPALVAELVATIVMGGGWNTTGLTVPHTELVLTTNINLGSKCLARYSDTYFINDEDWANYYRPVALSKNTQSTVSQIHPLSIRAKDEAWKNKLSQKGLLAE